MSERADPVHMTRAKDGAKALVESWEVKLWESYGFQVADAKTAGADQVVHAKRDRKPLAPPV